MELAARLVGYELKIDHGSERKTCLWMACGAARRLRFAKSDLHMPGTGTPLEWVGASYFFNAPCDVRWPTDETDPDVLPECSAQDLMTLHRRRRSPVSHCWAILSARSR